MTERTRARRTRRAVKSLIAHLRRLADDRLTPQERWLVLAFLGIVVLGSVVKYSRSLPVADTSPRPGPERTAPPAIDDDDP